MAKGPGTYLYVGLKARLLKPLVENVWHGTIDVLIGRVNSMRLPHCTLMYAKVEGKTPLINAEMSRGYATVVTEVRYIPHADVTCLILEKTRDLVKRHEYFKNMGLDLGYEFDPHVTVCHGDQVKNFDCLVGIEVDLGEEYMQVIVKE